MANKSGGLTKDLNEKRFTLTDWSVFEIFIIYEFKSRSSEMRLGATSLTLVVMIVWISCAEAKNAVFIIVDDLLPRLGSYGDSLVRSPHMDSLAKEATLFSRAYCQYPICGPSRASFMTGMRPDSTGVLGNSDQPEAVLKGSAVMNRYFASQGYEVAGLGKVYHNGPGAAGGWTTRFFESKWLDYVKPEHKLIGDLYFTPMRKKGQKMPSYWEAEDVADEEYCDGKVAAEAIGTLKEFAVGKKPFLMVIGFRHPHLPWCAPKKYWDLYDRKSLPIAPNREFPTGAPEVATHKLGELWSYENTPEGALTEEMHRHATHAYLACVSYVDAQVGKVIATLKELNLFEDTVIVLTSDNGYQMGNNGVWCKGVAWESTNRVPLIIRAPGHGRPGQVLNNLVELIDVYPTLCAATGVPIPKHCEGTSLVPLIDDPKAPWKDFAFTQILRGNVTGRSRRTDQYRFTLWEENGGAIVGKELYDLKTDPSGNVNLAGHENEHSRVLELTEVLRGKWPESRKNP